MAETRLALISFDGVNLLLPQSGVATIETAASVSPEASVSGAIGVLKSAAGEWPVYALAADFTPRTDCPASYKYCVAVNCGHETAFSLACEEVGSISVDDEDDLKPMQACMRTPQNPIESLVLRDGKLMLVSDVQAMQHYLLPEAAA
jgi:hypothetical protein